MDFIYIVEEGDKIRIGYSYDLELRWEGPIYLRAVKDGFGQKYKKRVYDLIGLKKVKGHELSNITLQEAIKYFGFADWYFDELERKNIEIEDKVELNFLNSLKNNKKFKIIEKNS